MKKLIKILAAVILLGCVYSFVPVIGLYLEKDPAPYTNAQVVKKLEGNKGDYFGFVVLGDCHSGMALNDSATLKIVRSVNRESRFRKLPIDFAAVSGDLTFRGSEWDYRIYNKIRSLVGYPVVSAIGNHDRDKGGYRFFKKYAGEDELSFADRNSYFMIMNNVTGNLSDEQFVKLERELAGSSAYKHRFIIMHKPPLSPYLQSWYRPELGGWSYRFMKLCEKYKVDIVFAGHEHMFKEETLGGVKYVTSGGGGMITHIPAKDGGFLHYVVVRVYGDYVDYEVRRISPPSWEFFAYYMWKDAFYFLKGVFHY